MDKKREERKKLKAGDFSIFTKTVTETDVMLYAGLSGDMNPYYLNDVYAEPKLGQAMISAAQLQAMAGGAIFRLLPEGSIRIQGEYRLVKPALRGETIIARAEILKVDEEKGTIAIAWECYSNDKELLIKGKSLEQLLSRHRDVQDIFKEESQDGDP